MFALKVDANSKHMQTSKMPKHEILNKCKSGEEGFYEPQGHDIFTFY